MSTDGPDWQEPTSSHRPYPPYYPQPTYPAPKPPPNRGPLIIAISVFVVIALAVLTTVLIINRNGTDDAAQPSPSPTSSTTSSAPSTTASTSPSTSPPPSPVGTPTTVEQISVTPVTSGWQGVWSYKDGVAYDVPPDWKVETPDNLVGFEDNSGKPIAIMHGVSTYRDEACSSVSGSYRGRVGFKTTGDQDPAQAAATIAKLFAAGAALRDNGSSAPVTAPSVTDITVDQGTIAAKYARVTVTLNDKSDCGSPTIVVVAVAFRSLLHKTATFVGYFDQGVPDALPLTTLSKIFTTLRPYQR